MAEPAVTHDKDARRPLLVGAAVPAKPFELQTVGRAVDKPSRYLRRVEDDV